MTNYLLTIDQGTSSTRAIIFDHNARLISCAQQELTQYYPENGWVEHDGEEIWQTSKNCVEQALLQAKLDAAQIAAMGIANQRETTLLWHRDSGELLHRAIVWQDRRTAATCQSLIKQGYAEVIQQKTGLLIDPYFSATKLSWLLDHVPHARDLAEQGKLAFGTVDSFLLWRLSGGQVHATDATNAARTMLFNIVSQAWDDELLALFGIPASVLPEVCDSSGVIAYTDKPLFGGHSLPIAGVAGDQQAAAIGQACVKPGMIKSTYGTGCFALMNTGERLVQSQHRLLSTVAYRIDQQVSYALEGSIFVAGAAVQWLRDAMQLIKQAPDTETYAKQLDHNHGVYLVPAFTGLGAPYWDPLARGAIFGLTRETGLACIVRATLEAVCYQTRDLLDLMFNELGQRPNSLQVDGGMVANDWLMQFLSDMINLPVVRPKVHETSALGAAYLAGLGVGVYDNLDELAKLRQVERQFTPQLHESTRENLYKGWLDAVQRVRSL